MRCGAIGETQMSEVITLQRRRQTGGCTLGVMDVFGKKIWTLEDPRRKHKVHGETRIPAGRYKLELRNEGGMTQRYARRFPDMHQGMIWLREVEFFEWVYIHIGNRASDTEGCILVGMKHGSNVIYQSKMAYELIYPKITEAINQGGCFIEIHDEPCTRNE
jgi:hypothetical protein